MVSAYATATFVTCSQLHVLLTTSVYKVQKTRFVAFRILLCPLMMAVSRALALATFFAASSLAASVGDWQCRSIYQV